MPQRNILLAMFDIKPTGKAAGLVLEQIKNELNLLETKVSEKKTKAAIEKPVLSPDDGYWEELIARLPQRPDFPLKYELSTFSKREILKELEKTIGEPIDVEVELASVGGIVHQALDTKARTKIARRRKTVMPEITETETPEPIVKPVAFAHSPASREMEIWLQNLQKNREIISTKPSYPKQPSSLPKIQSRKNQKWSSWFRFNRKPMVWFLAVAVSGLLIGTFVRHQGIWARNNIIQNGSNAVANLEDAKRGLENFDFIGAADSFALAYDDLNKASGTLNQFGASFLSAFDSLPGLNKIRAANNLVEAGQSLSKAGENLALAFGTLYKTNLLSFLDLRQSAGKGQSISKLLAEFKDILKFAENNVEHASGLLGDIDASLIPEDKQELFLDFKEKIPAFQRYVGEAVDY